MRRGTDQWRRYRNQSVGWCRRESSELPRRAFYQKRKTPSEVVSFYQWTIERPGTGDRKYGMREPLSDPMYTVRRSGPPNVTLAIHGAMPCPVANRTSSVT